MKTKLPQSRRVSTSRIRQPSVGDAFFRSRLERVVASDLKDRGVRYEYEANRIKYVSTRAYIPDFLLPNGIYIEVKGWFRPSDRSKHLKIKKQHPDIDIRFVFSSASQKLNRNSTTTYSQWCDRYGFQWSEKVIPQGWLNEPAKRIQQ